MMKEQYSKEEVVEILRNAIEDRAKWFYLVLKYAKELGVDQKTIDQMAEKAIWDFGVGKGQKMGVCSKANDLMNKIYDGPVIGAFEMEKIEEGEEQSILEFSYCALVEVWKKLGCSDDEIAQLCDYASCGDFGLASISPELDLSFNELLSKGGNCCRMIIKKK